MQAKTQRCRIQAIFVTSAEHGKGLLPKIQTPTKITFAQLFLGAC